jgi:hypothetical protein
MLAFVAAHRSSAPTTKMPHHFRLSLILSKPDCEVTAPKQCVVVLRPMGHRVLGLGELVAATLAMFVSHLQFLQLEIVTHHDRPGEQNRNSDLYNNAAKLRVSPLIDGCSTLLKCVSFEMHTPYP